MAEHLDENDTFSESLDPQEKRRRVDAGEMGHYDESIVRQVTIKHASGARACVQLFGAHLTSWTSPRGKELIFLSRNAKVKPPSAIRGGIPICFPQFSDMGPLASKHGFARNSTWELAALTTNEVKLALRGSRQLCEPHDYPPGFVMTVTYTLEDHSLTCVVDVRNDGNASMEFGCALHTYFKVEDVTAVRVERLQGINYLDSLDFRAKKTQTGKVLMVDEEVDRIYLCSPPCIKLVDPVARRTLTIEKSNLSDLVVWNPWVDKAKTLSDFAPDEYKVMLCLEAGCIQPTVTLQPLEKWRAEQVLTVEEH